MPRLILLRHAKSAWDTDAPTDHERPLNKRGKRDAPRIGAELRRLGWVPEVVISSDSERTRQTWRRLERGLDSGVSPTFTRALYHAGVGQVLAAMRQLDEGVECAMLIGHNPGWEDAVEALSGRAERITTCNAALLSQPEEQPWDSPQEWQLGWQLERVLRPKEL